MRGNCCVLITHAYRFSEGKCWGGQLTAAIHDIMKAESHLIDCKIIMCYRFETVTALSSEMSSEVNRTSCSLRFHELFFVIKTSTEKKKTTKKQKLYYFPKDSPVKNVILFELCLLS